MGCRVLRGNYEITQGCSSSHIAVDIVGPDTITAHSEGTVVWRQTGYGNNQGSSGNASYGNCIKLRHANGYYTLYAHMSTVSVSDGQQVGKGQKIGVMGNTGNSYGAHLHFEVRNGGDVRMNPIACLNADLPGLKGGGSTANTGTSGYSEPARPKKVEITDVKVVSVQGNEGKRPADRLLEAQAQTNGCEILTQSGGQVLLPALTDKVSLEWSRKGAPGCLKFSCVLDGALTLTEGNPVRMKYRGQPVFYGYVFERSQSDPYTLSVTCYDQLRYFRNETTLAYNGKKYSDLVRELAAAFQLKCGTVEDTGHVIPQRLEEGTVFDILGNASDETLSNRGALFVLYDDCGSLYLRKIDSMFVPILIDEGSAGGFSYGTSIDKDVYSKVVFSRENDETGVRELYVANNEENQKSWGILTYYETQNDAEPAAIRESAKLLLEHYGRKRRSLRLAKCFGDARVRGGSSLVVRMALNDKKIQNVMVVEKVKHSFEPGLHTMDLDLVGINGEFVV